MGASYFEDIGEGATAQEAFDALVEQAYWDFGHNGYTGTICEKRRWQMATEEIMDEKDARELADDLASTEPFSSKWDPAGAIKLTDGRWLFFGIAPS